MNSLMQKLWIIYLGLVTLHSPLATVGFAQNKDLHGQRNVLLSKSTPVLPPATLININKLSMWIRADGASGWNPHPNTNWGVMYPRGTAGLVYQDGILWGGLVRDGQTPELRVGGQAYHIATQPGRIISPGLAEDLLAPDVRIWRVRRDWQTADLRQDATELLNKPSAEVTAAEIDSVRRQYEKDWQEWPWQKGAPFYDDNRNGRMDAGEAPGLAHADQVVWFVANDLDSGRLSHVSFKSVPMGLELQVTLWAYNRDDAYGHIIFKRYRLNYKGTSSTFLRAQIDSMFVGQFSEPNVGQWGDELAGCDTTLALIYGYNSSNIDPFYRAFNLLPPAVGYAFVQGLLVRSENSQEIGRFDLRELRGYKNLGMIAALSDRSGDPMDIPPSNAPLGLYMQLNGYSEYSRPGNLQPFRDPRGIPTKFMYSGDPFENTGWLDYSPSVRQILAGTGPFSLALGDTQEVIIALVAGSGNGHLASIPIMKQYTKWAHLLAKTNFDLNTLPPAENLPPPTVAIPNGYGLSHTYPNPFSLSRGAQMAIRYQLPRESDVDLVIHDVLGREIKTLVHHAQPPGDYSVTWDGTTAAGEKVAAGIYFVSLRAWIFERTRKIVVVR